MLQSNPQGWTLRVGKVIEVHPHDNSLDVVFMDDGTRMIGVQCLAPAAGTNFGLVDIPQPTKTDDWDNRLTKDRDMLAVVAMTNLMPLCIGFIYPQVNQMLFDYDDFPDFKVSRHASDVYHTIDKDGNVELYHPSGTWIRIGKDQDHLDLTAKDWDKKWKIAKNLEPNAHIKISTNGGKTVFHVEPDGNVSLTTEGSINIDADGNIAVNAKGAIDIAAEGTVGVQAQGQIEITSNDEIKLTAAAVRIN